MFDYFVFSSGKDIVSEEGYQIFVSNFYINKTFIVS